MKPEDIIKEENLVFERTPVLNDMNFTYCAGCGHGVVHRLIAEVIEEMDVVEDTIGVCPVGCSVIMGDLLEIDMVDAAHGRAPAVATGIRRLWPDKYVFTYQGDGDLAAIGTNETIHTCNRGENILIVFVNNAIYGMTGGQMAPTTIKGMNSSTSPYGRDTSVTGAPIKITEMVAQLEGVHYATRSAVHKPAYVRKTKKAIQKGLEYQKQNKGTCIVEVVSNCNSAYKMKPRVANKWVEENLIPYYPLGDIKVDGKLVNKKDKE